MLKNDCEKGAGVGLAKTYEVRVYPTYALVDAAGEVTDRWAGFGGVADFGARLDAALSDRSPIAQKRRRFQSEPTLPLALSLAQYSEAVFANVEAVDFFRTIMALDPARALEMRGKIFMAMYYGLREGDYAAEQLVAEGWALLDEPELDLEQMMQVVRVVKRAAPVEAYLPMLERALAATGAAADDPDPAADLASYRSLLAVDEALLLKRDRPLALRLQRANLEPNWQQDPDEIHRFVWWCYENDLNLAEAGQLALQAADLASGDADRAGILATAAAIAFKCGDLQAAVALQEKAVALAPGRERYRRQLEPLLVAREATAGELLEPRTGTVYPDRVTIEQEDRRAVLRATGAGVRLRTLLKTEVYTMASYVSAGLDRLRLAGALGGAAEAIRTFDVPKRLQMDLRRGVSRQKLVDTFVAVIARNYPDTGLFSADLDVFLSYFDRDAQKGDRLVFDYLPGVGLITTVNGEVKGAIANPAMAEALWTVWFGEKPADGNLKRDLTAGV